MRWNVFILFLVLIISSSCVTSATLFSGKYYSGESFSFNNATFNIFGNNAHDIYDNATNTNEIYYKSVFISSKSDSPMNIPLGSCKLSEKYKYCYTSNAVDTKNYRITDGKFDSMLEISINSLDEVTTSLTVTRSNINAYCGNDIKIPITIKNTGDTNVAYQYTEKLPTNTVIMDTSYGNVINNVIIIEDFLYSGFTKNYSYIMNNLDCESKSWDGMLTYESKNGTVKKVLSNLALKMSNSVSVTSNISKTKTNNLDEEILYNFTIKNSNPENVNLKLNVNTLDLNIISTRMQKFSNTYYISKIMSENDVESYTILFSPTDYGTYTIITNYTIEVNNLPKTYSIKNTLYVLEPRVRGYFEKKGSIISIVLKNEDLKNSYSVYGIFKGLGDESIYFKNLSADSSATIFTRSYNYSSFPKLVFDGVYRDKTGNEKELYFEIGASKDYDPTYVIEMEDDLKIENASNPVVLKNETTVPKDIDVQNNQANTNINIQNVSSETSNSAPKKDLITSMLEGISNFLSGLLS